MYAPGSCQESRFRRDADGADEAAGWRMYPPDRDVATTQQKGNTVSNTVLKTFADLKAAKGPKFEQPKPISSLEPEQPTQTKPQPPVDLLRKVR
jgi:hypothetical protein